MIHARNPLRSLAVIGLACATLAGSGFGRTDASQLDTELLFNQKFFGLISSAIDEDVVSIEDVAGSKITVVAKRDSGNGMKPDVDILDANFAVLDSTAFKTKTSDSAEIKNFPLPSTGTFHVRVRTVNGFTGTYSLTLKGKPPKKPDIGPGTISSAGEVDGLSFVARSQSKLSGSIERTGGNLIPLAIELVSPTGVLVPLPGNKAKLNSAQNTLTLTGIGLPSIGSYQLRITGQAGTTGGYVVNFKVTPPKPTSDSIYEDEHPTPIADDSSPITLREVFFGRGLRNASGGLDVVSPFTVVKTDPVSNLPVPGTLQSIFPGIDVLKSIPFNLDTFYAPMIVPRNSALVLRFNRPPSKASLNLTDEDVTTTDTPIEVSVNGVIAQFEVIVKGNDIILNPSFADTVGMPPSPLAVDAEGNPVAANDGAAKLSITSGVNGLTASDGGLYKPRADLLGSPDSGGEGIGFNPGNQVLDFFKQSTVDGVVKTYTGFLPDETSPRIVRELKVIGDYTPNFLDPALGDAQGLDTMAVVLNEALDVTLNNGKGEYANGVFRLRPAGPNREQHVIVFHTVTPLGGGLFRNDFKLASKVKIPLKAPNGADPGDRYEIVRAEYYEPDPENPIDPELFDPNDPDLAENTQIANFVEAIDRDGELQDIQQPIDPKSTLTMRFSEPMLLESFRPYETFYVTDNPASDNYGINYVGRVVSSDGGKAITFQPFREIQSGVNAGTIEQIGFGPTPLALRLHLVAVPSSAALTSLLGEAGVKTFIAGGQRGVSDLGGQPLAFQPGVLSASTPFVDFSIAFTTNADPSVLDTGAIVHRFLGQPLTGSDDDGNTGVAYKDMPDTLCGPLGNLYGPRIADVNLFSNGFLSGAPVAFFQKIHDDFNPPPATAFTAFPFGTSTPIGGFSVLGGAKLQHVYRAVDCSPDYEALAGTLLDLFRVDFAPLTGVVANTVLPDISIHSGHTAVVPDTDQSGGIPGFGGSGLGGGVPAYAFGGHQQTLGNPGTNYVEGSYNGTLAATGEESRRQVVFGTLKAGNTHDLYDGKTMAIDGKFLYSPAGSPSRKFHPLPPQSFDNPFPYNNGAADVLLYPAGATFGTPFKNRNQSLLLEYRVRVHDSANPPSTQNVFTFAVGILSSALPRFRIFTFGGGCTACCTAANCVNTCGVSYGPAFTGLANGGGAPLDPDRIINAVGPNVSAPGLACFCHGTTTNQIPCGPGLSNQTNTNPTLANAAQGIGTPSGSANFGDNSRYFMVFNYVKRESLVRSPFVRAQPEGAVTDPVYLEPIFTPPLSQLPTGTTFDVKFRASTNGQGAFDATPYVAPEDIATLNGGGRPYLQFEARVEGNTSSQLVPVFDEIVIPFRKSP